MDKSDDHTSRHTEPRAQHVLTAAADVEYGLGSSKDDVQFMVYVTAAR